MCSTQKEPIEGGYQYEPKNLLISGFADEIDPSLNRQLEALQKMGIRYIEMRGVDGKSLVHCTDSELSVIHRKLDAAGVRLSSVGSPIGKIGIDEKILNKPGRLTPEEFEVVKTHSMLGAEMLHQLEDFNEQPLLQTAYEITRWHHERWDGRGYPDGLKGDEIPISAQLVALADVYDALTSERCYKKAFSHEKAVQMILNGECGAFNPLLLQCLTDVQTDLKVQLQQRTQ